MAKDSGFFSPRVRFNWGFHDAQGAAERNSPKRDVSTHFDRDYARGYLAGLAAWELSPVRAESSEPAWQAHLVDKAQRKAARNAQPARTDLRI
jgi:hypothetical protein